MLDLIMKKWILFLVIVFFVQHSFSQQAVDSKKMNYIIMSKPNNIFYHDSLFRGSSQYKDLFYRTNDQQLINLFQKHQSNKVVGGVLSFIGAFATGFGVAYATSNNGNKTSGWIIAGSGFAATLVGGVLTFSGQRNLQQAVELFNAKYNKATVGIGVSPTNAGLVLNF